MAVYGEYLYIGMAIISLASVYLEFWRVWIFVIQQIM